MFLVLCQTVVLCCHKPADATLFIASHYDIVFWCLDYVIRAIQFFLNIIYLWKIKIQEHCELTKYLNSKSLDAI